MPDISVLKDGALKVIIDDFIIFSEQSGKNPDLIGPARDLQARINSNTQPSANDIGVIEAALRHADILTASEKLEHYSDNKGFWRGGAECFLCDATVTTTDHATKHFVSKHYITSGGRSDLKTANILNRHASLEQMGVHTPKLYSAGNAHSYEERIPHSIKDALKQADPPTKQHIAQSLAKLAARFDAFGINPGFSQVMIHNNNEAFLVDFGMDLPESFRYQSPPKQQEALQALKTIGPLVGDDAAHANAQTLDAVSNAKNAFKPELRIEETYQDELRVIANESRPQNETTLMLIKPGFTQYRNHILGKIAAAGLKVAHISDTVQIPTERAQQFYAEHKAKSFFDELVTYMSSAPLIAVSVEGPNAIKRVRELNGKTNPKDAAEGTIRAKFGIDGTRNTVHSSDSPESAARELAFWGKELGLKPGEHIQTDPNKQPTLDPLSVKQTAKG